MLKALVLSQRRSGSTFGVKTTKVALGLNPDTKHHFRSVIPYTRCNEILNKNYFTLRWQFWRNHTHIVKIEEPYSHPELVEHLIATFPKVKAITTLRSIESIVSSRMSLKQAWGKSTSAQKVIEEWVSHYHFLEGFVNTHPDKIFVIDIDQPQTFNASAFCDFLGVTLTPEFKTYSESFLPVNTFSNQARKHKIDVGKDFRQEKYSRQELIEIFSDLEKYENLYMKIARIGCKN